MPVRYDDPRPPYEQLAAELRDAITTGDYQPGDRLPSTRELAEANGISQVTVQHALSVLREEGLIVGQQGRGVYVQQPAADQVTEPPGPEGRLGVKAALDDARKNLEEARTALGLDPEPEADDVDFDTILAEIHADIAAIDATLKGRGPQPHQPDVWQPEPEPPAPDLGPDV